MKKFEMPEIEVIMYSVEDVVTSSLDQDQIPMG